MSWNQQILKIFQNSKKSNYEKLSIQYKYYLKNVQQQLYDFLSEIIFLKSWLQRMIHNFAHSRGRKQSWQQFVESYGKLKVNDYPSLRPDDKISLIRATGPPMVVSTWLWCQSCERPTENNILWKSDSNNSYHLCNSMKWTEILDRMLWNKNIYWSNKMGVYTKTKPPLVKV